MRHQRRVGAEARALGEAQTRRHPGRHGGHLLQELPVYLLPAVDHRAQAGQVALGIIRQTPFELKHRPQQRHLALFDGRQRFGRIEDVQQHRRAAPEQRGHQQLRLAAHVRGRQIDQHAAVLLKVESGPQAHVLRRDVAVGQQRWFRAPGRARGEDDLRSVLLAYLAKQRRHFRLRRQGPIGQRAQPRARRQGNDVLEKGAGFRQSLRQRAQVREPARLNQTQAADDFGGRQA